MNTKFRNRKLAFESRDLKTLDVFSIKGKMSILHLIKAYGLNKDYNVKIMGHPQTW